MSRFWSYHPDALNYKIVAVVRDRQDSARTAQAQLMLPEFQALSILDARNFLTAIEIPSNDSTARMLRDEICARLNYLCEVGVGYLTLHRSTRTLSGGEVQRVNLTTCLGASLVNTLFVMDEPSIGLHPRDVGQLVRVMHNLRDKGNTLLVVEHEEQIIRAADNLIDLGPGSGEHGGKLVWNGPIEEFLGSARILRACEGILPSQTSEQLLSDIDAATNPVGAKSSSPQNAATSTLQACTPRSLTRDYLTGRQSIPIPKSRRKPKSSIKIAGALQHKLKNIDVDLQP